MISQLQDFEKLHARKRLKFIKIDEKFFVYNVPESYLLQIDDFTKFSNEIVTTTNPPVKTLILHTTYECNLGCNHCYINAGSKKDNEMDSSELSKIVKEFGEMGGLCVDLSGGEALLKNKIEDVIKTAREQKLRTVVLSNAVNLDSNQLENISPYIDGMAVGLDGLYSSNDDIRGKGSFEKTVKGLEKIAETGIELSLTTLITPESIPQLTQFPEFISKYGGKSWSLVMPRLSGRFMKEKSKIEKTYLLWEEVKNKGLLKELQIESKKYNISVVLDHILVPGAKRKIEETSKNFVYDIYNKGRACWDNTITIMPNGDVKCCLFFNGQVYDNVKGKSLKEVYESSKRKTALLQFKKYPVDKCPFVEKHQLECFDKSLK
ncbi:MAG: radical SAM protein [Candidatus Pacearchaeota archaeon]|nr:radical SAM protein [Candidatus Pacearchaeota archaeon]